MNIVARAITTREGQRMGCDQDNYIAATLNSGGNDGGFRSEPGEHLVYQCHGSNVGPMGTCRSGRGDVTSGVPFVATFDERNVTSKENRSVPTPDLCHTIHSDSPRLIGYGVRRLTPRECERLQGFPDDWTKFGHDGKEISDSARYRALGNAVAVPVVEWIGKRIVSLNTQ